MLQWLSHYSFTFPICKDTTFFRLLFWLFVNLIFFAINHTNGHEKIKNHNKHNDFSQRKILLILKIPRLWRDKGGLKSLFRQKKAARFPGCLYGL